MEKLEIKEQVKEIIEAIKGFKRDLGDTLSPLYDIKVHFEAIMKIELSECIETELDFEEAERTLLWDIMENDSEFNEIHVFFDNLLEELEEFEEAKDIEEERKQSGYIETLKEIKDSIDTSYINSTDEFEEALDNAITSLTEMI